MSHNDQHHHSSALHVNEGVPQPEQISKSSVERFKRAGRKLLSAQEYAGGILAGNRTLLSQAITLVESSRQQHHELAQEVISRCLPHAGNSVRIGITGVPGVGKSTFIEAMGTHLTALGHQLAVLAIDPSSTRTKGSILGDKTRMEALSVDKNAFIRPSPSSGSLGGVARKTRESIILCEAAGFDVIFVETVGVGQSETTVHGMVDFFLLLMLAGAGDELQGIKRGIMEMADAICINKADGDNQRAAQRARVEYQNALHLFPPTPSGWTPPVQTCSARANTGIGQVWETVQNYLSKTRQNGFFQDKRQEQKNLTLREAIDEMLQSDFYNDNKIKTALPQMQRAVRQDEMSAYVAARQLVDLYDQQHLGNNRP
jgi:LAO/AO transport system kinase